MTYLGRTPPESAGKDEIPRPQFEIMSLSTARTTLLTYAALACAASVEGYPTGQEDLNDAIGRDRHSTAAAIASIIHYQGTQNRHTTEVTEIRTRKMHAYTYPCGTVGVVASPYIIIPRLNIYNATVRGRNHSAKSMELYFATSGEISSPQSSQLLSNFLRISGNLIFDFLDMTA